MVDHEFDTGTLIDCDESDKDLTLCLDSADNPVTVDDPTSYADLVGQEATVIWHTEDGERLYIDDIEAGKIESWED